jgi:thiol-disulfide isomerase/thioredoxin
VLRTEWGRWAAGVAVLVLLLAGCDPGGAPPATLTPVVSLPSPTVAAAPSPTSVPPTLAGTFITPVLITPILATPGGAAPGAVPSAASGPVQPGAIVTEAALPLTPLPAPRTPAPAAISPTSGKPVPRPVTTAGAPPPVATGGPQGNTDPKPGGRAPNIVVTRLDNGARVKLSDFAGRPIWLNFWASWCEPCKAEMPTMQRLYDQYKDTPLVLLGVDSTEDQATAQQFVTAQHYNWLFALDASSAASFAYGVVGVPTHIFIRRDGTIQAVIPGGLTGSMMVHQVQALLK